MTNSFLKGEDLDRLGLAIIALGRELWVVKDRLKALESYMESQGVLPPAAIDKHRFTEQQAADMQVALDQFVDSLAAQLSGKQNS